MSSPAAKCCCQNESSNAANGCCHSKSQKTLPYHLIIHSCFESLSLSPLRIHLQELLQLSPCIEHLQQHAAGIVDPKHFSVCTQRASALVIYQMC